MVDVLDLVKSTVVTCASAFRPRRELSWYREKRRP
jgi:hypothetical protein